MQSHVAECQPRRFSAAPFRKSSQKQRWFTPCSSLRRDRPLPGSDSTSCLGTMSLRMWLLFGALGLVWESEGAPRSRSVCTSIACQKAAENILAAMNAEEDPCEDFYSYACGKWSEKHPLLDNMTEVSIFEDLNEEMKKKRQLLMESVSKTPFASEVKAKAFYKQCVDKASIEKLRSSPMTDYLNAALGGWPILNPKWNASQFDLLKTLLFVRVQGNEPLITVFASQDMEHPENNIIFLNEANTYGVKDVLLSEAGENYTASYKRYMTAVVQTFMKDTGDARAVQDVEEEVQEMVDFGRYLSVAGQSQVEKRNLTLLRIKTNFQTIMNTTFYRSIFSKHLLTYVKGIYAMVGLDPLVNSTMDMVLRSPQWFVKLDEKLYELELQGEKGKRILANYISWRIVTESVDYLHKDLRRSLAQHNARIKGSKQMYEKPASERCTNELSSVMPHVLGALYVRDLVPPGLKEKAKTMITDLKESFRDMLTAASWMDTDTFSLAIEKLEAMVDYVGFPDIYTDNITAIDNDYANGPPYLISSSRREWSSTSKNCTIQVGTTYFRTVLDISKNINYKGLKRLEKKNTRLDPIQDAYDITNVNAYNALTKNFIVVLAAALQPPLFNPDTPQYLNYGASGFFVGHEVTHGFDDQGASFDSQGMMSSWWTNRTMDTYNRKKQGIAEQYSAYELSTGNINGELTLGENIADNGGLKAAFRGYNRYKQRLANPEPSLPGLEHMTADQLFFLSGAQVWCQKQQPEAERLHLLTDLHSPFKYRVIGPMSNMPEFSKAFRCPLAAGMNPPKKNAVW